MRRSRISVQLGTTKIWVSVSAARKSAAFERLLNSNHSPINIDISHLEQILTVDGFINAARYLKNEEIILDKKTAFRTLVAAAVLEIPDLVKALETSVYCHSPEATYEVRNEGQESEVDWNQEPLTGPLVKETQSAYQLETLRAEEWEGSIWKKNGTLPHPGETKKSDSTDSLPHAALTGPLIKIKGAQSAYELETLREEEWEASIWKETGTGTFPHHSRKANAVAHAVTSQFIFENLDWQQDRPINENPVVSQQ